MDEEHPEGTRRMLRDARARGLEVEIRPRPEARDLAQAAALLGIDPGDIVKTIVLRRTEGEYLFALVPGGRRVSWPKLRSVVGANRLALPDAAEALAATGYERGTITPLGSATAWPVFADESVAGRRIALGAGGPGLSAFADADALLGALGATVADIGEPE